MEGFCFSVGQVCVSLSGRFVYLLRGGFEKHLRNCSVFKKEEKAMYPLVVEIIQECHF